MHAGAVIVPAVLAACERYGRSGAAALVGMVIGVETLCRLSFVVPKAIHRAGFHPTAVLGPMAAAAGVGAALGLNERQLVDALGTAGSMAGGIIEYLAEGAWTKRMHAGWAAQSGLRAALLGRARCSRACTACSAVLLTPVTAIMGRSSAISASAGCWRRWRSSRILAGR